MARMNKTTVRSDFRSLDMSMYTDSSESIHHSNDTVESLETIPQTSILAGTTRRVVEEYEIGKSLGKGHFGQVKLAHRFTTGEMCALKIIEHKSTMSPRQHELFQREIEALSTIRHQNVISLRRVIPSINFPHEDGRNRQVLLLDLELCSGGELFDFVLSGGPFPECVAKHCFREIMNGLFACHSQGIYHRDLKPENIFISTTSSNSSNSNSNLIEFMLKIGDFGLASINGSAQSPLCKTPVGTRSYQAPEVMTSNGQAYDGGKADVWSAGVILFILLVGNPPFVVADRSDWWFNAVRLLRHKDFWKAHQRPPCTKVNENAMSFLNKIFMVDPKQRISLNEIINDSYLNNENVLYDAQMAQLFFNQITNKSKQEREMNLNHAKKAAQETARDTEVVFAQNVARSTSESASESTVSSSSTSTTTNTTYNKEGVTSDLLLSNGVMITKPPVIQSKEVMNSFDHYHGDTHPSSKSYGLKTFKLFTSTSPELLLQWITQEFQGKYPMSISQEQDYKLRFEIQQNNNNNDGKNQMIKRNENAFIGIQIWTIEDEEGVFMIECSLIFPDDDDQKEGEEEISNLTFLCNQQWILTSFWYNELLLCLKVRGCQEATSMLDEMKLNKRNYITENSSSLLSKEDNENDVEVLFNKLFFKSQQALPYLFQLQPPPTSDDPLFHGMSLALQQELSPCAATLENEGDDEPSILAEGHDDIF